MINLNVNCSYIEDLFDDVCDNTSEHLYAFIGNDPVKAFYFAMNIKDWASKLAGWQVRLYSRELRHVHEEIENLYPQIKFWQNKYMELFEGKDVTLIHFPTYVLNNIIVDNDKDLIRVSLMLGANTADTKKRLESEKNEEGDINDGENNDRDKEAELV